uniref:Thioredoxin domain-containing protein n=1 Tax=Aegilops tauschii subsp. strangulata TaxID=200361 RepID=A0A453D1T6_AEGTS
AFKGMGMDGHTRGELVAAHFGASWCVTSLSMNYKFEELAQTHPDMLFLFVDVDDVPGVSSKLGVKAMPTFFLIKGKEVVKKIVGANSDELHKMVDASDDDSLGSAVTTLPDIVIE